LPARKRRITLPRKFFDGTVPFDLPIDTAPAPKSHVQSSSDQYKYAYTELLGQFKFGDAKKDKAFSPSFLTAEKSEFLNYAQLKMSAYTWQKDLSWVSDLDWTPTNKVTLRKQFKFSVQLSEYGKLSGVAGTKGEVSGFVGVKKVTPKAGTEKNLSFLDEKVRFVENSSLDQFSTSKSVAVPLDSVAASKGGSKFNSKLTVVKCFIPDGNLSTFILGSRFKGVGASRGIQTQMYGGVCRESYSFSSVAISALNAYTFRMSDMPFADTNPYGMIYGFVGITTHLGFRREFANERIPVPVLDKEVSVRSAKSSSNSSLYKYLGFDRKYLGVTKLSGEHRSLLSSVSTAERSFCVSSVVAKSFPETWEAGFAWSSDQAWEYLGTSGVRTVFYEGIPRLSETSLSDSNFAFNAVTVMPHKGFSVLSKPLRRETRKGVGWQAVRDNVSMGLSVGVGSRYTSLPN
jgi:hypothetical protein